MKTKQLSIIDSILSELLKSKFKYKGMPVNILGLPSFSEKFYKRSFANALSKVKRNGLVKREGDFLLATLKGKKYFIKRQDSLSIFYSSFKKEDPKNLIVMFDIPETRKAEREWFRFHLKKFGYIMIQKSVWVGPSPLPKDFLSYLEEIKLKECIKTFKLAKPYKIKN